jgi:type IV fimbrial biogenesis protein FimT
MTVRKRWGFTLGEIMWALVACGLLMSIAAAKLQASIRKTRVRGAAAMINSGVVNARLAASMRGCAAAVYVASSSARMWVTACKTTGSGVDTLTSQDLGARFGVTLTTTSDSVRFNPTGLRADAGTTTVTVRESSGPLSQVVTIDQIGRVTRY